MQNKLNKTLVAAMALSATFVVALPTSTMAKVSGACGSCHTMHNSQGNAPMAQTFTINAGVGTFTANSTPNGSLLIYGCIGCHTGTNSGTTTVPFVLDIAAAPGLTSLAGGNFYWVTQASGDATGHNVKGIAGLDTPLGLNPPGGTALGSQLTCAGTMGCHGNSDLTNGGAADEFGSIAGGHHGSGGALLTDTTKTFVAGSTDDMSNAFRMLSGVIGIEDNNWEYGADTGDDGTTDHNQYYGVDRGGDADTAAGSISQLCANCHGDFHNGTSGSISADGSMSSPWVRHPTDFDMATAKGTEYAAYNGGSDASGAAAYSLIAPVASDTITGADSDLLARVNVTSVTANGSAIVTCISCHRAHGSPNADLLRWNYSTMDAHSGSSNTGCFICHTTKDDI